MRVKKIAVLMLLITLIGLAGVAPVASQGPDQPFTVTPLSMTSSVTVSPEKADALWRRTQGTSA